MFIGAALLLAVIACGWLLGKKANDSVRRFRSENHESFRPRQEP